MRGAIRRWRFKVAVVTTTGALVASGLALAGGGSGVATAKQPAGAVMQRPSSGHMAAGKMINAASTSSPSKLTAAQRASQKAGIKFLAGLPAAPTGAHTSAADVNANAMGPETTLTGPRILPNDFQVFKNSTIPSKCAACGQSTVNEPATANAGKVIVQTSNWNIAYTLNGGANPPTWQYQNPYALSAAFCCDQEVLYEPSRDRFVYQGLTLGSGTQVGFTIATTKSLAPTSWCVYHFDSSNFGGTAGEVLDYPKISYSNNYTYVTWNRYNAAGTTFLSTGMARLPTDAISSCAGFSYFYINRTDSFTFGLTRGGGSLDTYYWVSNWYTAGGSGANMRIYYWPENSSGYAYVDRAINAYAFTGGSCASQDGVVTNWCSRLDPRWESPWISNAQYRAQANGAFAGDSVLGVAITAGPGGGDPFPYVVYEYFKLNGLSYIGSDATFNTGFAFAYPGCTTNVHGYVGCAMSWGGGTGTTHYYPGGFILQQDNVSPTQPWAYSYLLFGSGNASAWGDYDVTLPFEPNVGPFISTLWAVNGSGVVTPHVVIFGRNHDIGGYNRWKSK
jgi:hypothetical protein